ncbi:MAG: flagellar basal-body rod protein FlgC [Clostridiales bacterium]|nr:flagellar basal-body rod protein FlgC [Clostridiales bacterium]
MGMFNAINNSASGLTAQRLRMDIISQNIANVNTTRTPEGGPYVRQMPLFSQSASGMVQVQAIVADPRPFKLTYDPSHPDADQNGYVLMPNVDVTEEMVDMVSATRSYEANVTVIDAAKNMAMRAIDIAR